MKKKDIRKMPRSVLIYQFDQDEKGKPLYTVALSVNELPEDYEGCLVAQYNISSVQKFCIERKLV